MKAINKIFIKFIIILMTLLGFLLPSCPLVKYGPGPDGYKHPDENSSSSSSSASSSSSVN